MTYLSKKTTRLVTVSALAVVSVLTINSHLAMAQGTESSTFSWGFNSDNADVDQKLAKANVQIKYDGLDVEPQLNISANHGDVTVNRNEQVQFNVYWNYGAFIKSADVRIFASDQSVQSEPLLTLPIGADQRAVMSANANLPDDIIYVVRVYDEAGQFDETTPKLLSIVDSTEISSVPGLRGSQELNAGTGYGIDRTSIRNIQVKGGGVTVYGTDLTDSAKVSVQNQSVLIDQDGQFAVQMILPFGRQVMDVIVNDRGAVERFQRDIRIDETEFFYVAIGDVTLGSSDAVGPADFLGKTDRDFDDVTAIGRGAFYLKGRVKGDYTVTAALDTGEDRIGDVFRNLDDKDPRQLLRRLDSDRFLPVYGDDSTLVEDAPTQGRFYAKIEKGDSHVLWGNFATQITGTEFAHLDRGLYGGVLDYNSQGSTSYGERRTQVTAFAADPGTVPAREEFRGTGGSVYFLERQDLSIGSERVRIEIRDKVSGLVVETRDLRPQEDYDVDYIQGRILLSNPLQSTVRDNQVVRDSALSGNDTFLVVRYEFTPSLSNVNGFTFGGRATHWLGDSLRLGVTGQNEETGSADQNLFGVDFLLRQSAGTYLKGEFAQTDGPAFDQSRSSDGGFTFGNVSGQGAGGKSDAYRLEGGLDLADISSFDGLVTAYYDSQDDGFSGSNRLVAGDVERYGAAVSAQLSPHAAVAVKYDEIRSSVRGLTRALYGDVSYNITDRLEAELGLRYDEAQVNATAVRPSIDGDRTDLSAQFKYKVNSLLSIFGFGQATLDRDQSRQRNNRFGIGGDLKVNDRLSLQGEVSEGNGGIGANAQATFTRNDNSEFYLGYALSTDRTDTGFSTANQTLATAGTLTLGARTRYGDSLSVYGEERFGFGSRQSSLTHVYGLTFNPSELWSFGASIENGQIEDDVNGQFDRTAFSLSAARASETVRFASNLEARFEDNDQGGIDRDRTTWLMRNSLSIKANPNWTALGRFNFAISESDQSDFLDSDFVEGVIGAAYRPVYNDRLNALVSYTYFEDLSPAQQISAGGVTALPRQRSQIFNLDATYDLTPKLSIGGKYGFRRGEVALDRVNDDFISSNAQLGIVRLDYHVVNKWDLLAEARILSSSLADDERYGALLGLYRHVGDNAKIGAGYSFSKFSDDLRNFDTNNDGFFINLVGKF